ncbi:MAG: putative sulfate/molybdate transporter [Bacteroidota bacterium]|nr:putative sulfate/molybdate transporter [Rhodothermia bacterium]MCS7155883.1 putative sulfate/molybdate transporter [Bacteroidota bacterium]MDW8138144.1 putative sulfate/molybdate transporter [Bacteroidota bacterium]MDW8285828.1 putative sulfate/molybdate transporter [Bacteroidota bacterium]
MDSPLWRRESRPRLRFDRREWAGAFGDIGTDLPLLVGMILAAGLQSAWVLVAFGTLQILTGLLYRLPMPVQPLKAMAALVIAQKLPASVLWGGGLAIGLIMALLTATGLLERLGKLIPKPVVRGVQLGLGLQLGLLALREYVPALGWRGYAMALLGFGLLLVGAQARIPAGLWVVGFGLLYAWASSLPWDWPIRYLGLPDWRVPDFDWADLWTGLWVLALPQLPLSLANSLLATRQLAEDYFPERRVSLGKLGWTYAAMNALAPWIGGVPVCHGSGGMAGHVALGARTGGSVVIYGAVLLLLGLCWGEGFDELVRAFPLPVLGVLLLIESWALLRLLADQAAHPADFRLALLVGLLAAGLPYGYVVGLILGTGLYYGLRSRLA